MDIPQQEGRVLGGEEEEEEEVVGDVGLILGQPHGLARPKEAKRSDFLRQLILIFAAFLFVLPCALTQQKQTCPAGAREQRNQRGSRRIRVTVSKRRCREGSKIPRRVLHDAAVQQNQAI
jgi:hypothetical protein